MSKPKHPKPTFEFTIERSEWACASNNIKRGTKEAPADSMLLDHDGYKCCLGFLAETCGTNSQKLIDLAVPIKLDMPAAFVRSDLNSPDACDHAMNVNDHENNNTKRETKLKDLFAQSGIKVTFKGKYLK